MRKIFEYIMISLILGITSCSYSPDINTPRESSAINDLRSVQADKVTYLIFNYTDKLNVILISNRFKCIVDAGGNIPLISIAVEFQVLGSPVPWQINSVYFRTQDIPADGNFYSLSGDPVNESEGNASKLLVFNDSQEFTGIVPSEKTGDTDNFKFKAYPTGKSATINCEFDFQYFKSPVNIDMKGFLVIP